MEITRDFSQILSQIPGSVNRESKALGVRIVNGRPAKGEQLWLVPSRTYVSLHVNVSSGPDSYTLPKSIEVANTS